MKGKPSQQFHFTKFQSRLLNSYDIDLFNRLGLPLNLRLNLKFSSLSTAELKLNSKRSFYILQQ